MISNKIIRLKETVKIVTIVAVGGIICLLTAKFYYVDAASQDSPALLSFNLIKKANFTDETKLASMLGVDTRYKVGSIQRQKDGKEFLMVNGKKVFEGYNLSNASMSSDGTIAMSSYNALRNQIDGDGSDAVIDQKTGKLIQAISSVWIIEPTGTKHKITPDNVHATYPVISADGHWLAFSGETLDGKGLPGDQQIYVVSLENGAPSPLVSLNLQSMGVITPLKWENDQLVVLTTEAETPTSFQLIWVQIKPNNQK